MKTTTFNSIVSPPNDDNSGEEKKIAEEKAHEEAVRVAEELKKDDELERLRKEVEQLKLEKEKS